VGIGCLTDWYCQIYAIFLWICGGRPGGLVGVGFLNGNPTDRTGFWK
jgi:hypothetical protein